MINIERKKYNRVVIKIGTGVLTAADKTLNHSQLARSFEDLAAVRHQGIEVILVTSGAVATGRSMLQVNQKHVPNRQVYASIGQPLLLHAYQELARFYNLTVAQLLLTREDFDDRTRYLNIRNTLHGLLTLKVIPIINENDVVAVDVEGGDAFGGNDALAAMVGLLIEADILLILGETDGVLDAPPENEKAARIPVIKEFTDDLFSVVGKSSSMGRGGMKRKLEAAKLAMHSGIETVIADGRAKNIIQKIVLEQADTGTRFIPSQKDHSGRERWLVGGAVQRGSIFIDAKAAEALQKGKSLLPIGILAIEGDFQRGDAVRVLNEAGESVGVGLTNYTSSDLEKIKRLSSRDIGTVLGYHPHDEAIHKDNLALTSCDLTYGKG